MRYIVTMIKDFRDNWLRKFFVKDVQAKNIPADIRSRLFRKVQVLDDATNDADLRSPPSNHFEKLSGKFKNRCSIRVNDQWRLIFGRLIFGLIYSSEMIYGMHYIPRSEWKKLSVLVQLVKQMHRNFWQESCSVNAGKLL